LSKAQQQVYHLLLEGLRRGSSGFSVPRLPLSDLSNVYQLLRMDHPELFYAPTFTYRFYADADSVEIYPDYLFSGKQLEAQKAALEARITRILRPAAALSPEKQEQYIHDFLCQNVRYDKLKKPYAHEVYGPLQQGVGVCEGIAKTCKLLCDKLGIPNILILCPSNRDKGIRYRHMWNLIYLNGKYYHLDCTFDLSLTAGREIRYDYYNLNDVQIFTDHEPSLFSIPQCSDGRHSWYSSNRLAFTSTEDLEKRIRQFAKKKKPFTFQWKGSVVTYEVLTTLVTLIQAAAQQESTAAEISVNKPQGVFRLTFAEQAAVKMDTVTAFECEEET